MIKENKLIKKNKLFIIIKNFKPYLTSANDGGYIINTMQFKNNSREKYCSLKSIRTNIKLLSPHSEITISKLLLKDKFILRTGRPLREIIINKINAMVTIVARGDLANPVASQLLQC